MFWASAFAVCRSRITNTPTTATAQKTRTSSSVALCRKTALSTRSTVGTSAPGLCAASYFAAERISVTRPNLHVEFVSFVLREKLIHSHNLHRVIDITQSQVADRSWHIENEFADSNGVRENFWRHEDFTGEQAMKKMVLELTFVHLTNVPQNSFAFGLPGLPHNESDAASVRPVASFTQKNPAQFGRRQIVDGIGAVNDDGQGLSRQGLFRPGGRAGRGGFVPRRRKEQRSEASEDQQTCQTPHLRSSLEGKSDLQRHRAVVGLLALNSVVILNFQRYEFAGVETDACGRAFIQAHIGKDRFGLGGINILVAEIGPERTELAGDLGIETGRIIDLGLVVDGVANDHDFVQPFVIRTYHDGVQGHDVLADPVAVEWVEHVVIEGETGLQPAHFFGPGKNPHIKRLVVRIIDHVLHRLGNEWCARFAPVAGLHDVM